jgi:spoIIIJ-associated protein
MRAERHSVTVHAKSLDHAIKDAAKTLGVTHDQLDYELVSKTDAGGLLSFFGGKKVEIKAWSKEKTSSDRSNGRSKARAPRPVEVEAEKAELTEKELADLIEDLRGFCKGICQFMTDDKVEIEAHLDGDRLTLNVKNEYLADQIIKNPRLAESFEHILRKKPRYLKRELPFRIFVDANGLRINRENELVEMAKDLSMQVSENQRPIVLNYKSSYDRKIIHMALDRDDRVYTKSIGSGSNRKLMILPARAGDQKGQHNESEYDS